MLARANRLVSSIEFRSAIKSGSKGSAQHLVIYSKRVEASAPARFGFLVSKLTGNAVTRNLVKRRLREISRTKLEQCQGVHLVVRALPGAGDLSFAQLLAEYEKCLNRSLVK